MSDTSYLDAYLPAITVLGGDDDFAKYAKAIKRMQRVVSSLPPARRAVFAKQAAAIWAQYENLDYEILAAHNKAPIIEKMKALGVQAARITKQAHPAKAPDYALTTPEGAAEGPSAEDVAWAQRPENQPGYVAPAGAKDVEPDAVEMTVEPAPKKSSGHGWLYLIGGAFLAIVAGSLYYRHQKGARGWALVGGRRVRSKGGFLSGESTTISLAPHEIITGDSEKTRVSGGYLPLVESTKTKRARPGEATPTDPGGYRSGTGSGTLLSEEEVEKLFSPPTDPGKRKK